MARQLRMPGQIGDWFADLASSQPEAAAETGAALLVLLQADAIPGPPLVTDPEEDLDPREVLNLGYQALLARYNLLRHLAADATAIRREAEGELQQEGLDPAARAALEGEVARARQREDELSGRSARLGQQVSTFAARWETAKALVTAAEARRQLEDAFAELGLDTGTEKRAAEEAAAESLARAERVRAEADRVLGRARGRESDGSDVLELRADPLGSGIRVLFAEEPRGTITLLTALEDAAAVRAHRDEAIELAADLLEQVRAGGWPPVAGEGEAARAGLEFADTAAFLSGFFPGNAEDVADRAAALTRAASLAGLREQRGVSRAELARRIGSSEQQTLATERNSLLVADLEQVAAYVRSLGGTLHLTARFGPEQRRII